MSNGVQNFVNMKSCVFLIILLGFIRIIFCCEHSNETEDVCTVSWFHGRRKRANGEYTRWRFNAETTPEFIVKVLDDEITTGTPNPLVAVNILPVTKRGERIIVGGAMVPTTLVPSQEVPRDYTRFVPPTAKVSDPGQMEGFVGTTQATARDVIPPIQPDLSLPNKGVVVPPFLPSNVGRNVYRDESPPVSPQFLQRTRPPPLGPVRQYAPIAPVAFTRRTTSTPLKPLSYARFNTEPTRSTPATAPTRTLGLLDKIEKLEDFPILEALVDEDGNQITATRTSLKMGPLRTQSYFDNELQRYLTTVSYRDILLTSPNIKETESEEIETSHRRDQNYNMFFYGTDYKKDLDVNNKNEYDDTHEQVGESVTKDSLLEGAGISGNKLLPVEEGDTDLLVDNKTADVQYPEDKIEATPDKSKTGAVIEIKLPTKSPDSVISRDRRRPVCNMIKLRPLNFNSPRTLPEIVDQLKQWTEESPVAQWADITGGNLTIMENPIYIMIVDDPSVGQVASEKQNVLLIAGISGRDHHAVAAAMYVLYQLVERSDTHQDLLSKYRFWVIPVFNPDGYDYSMTFPHRRNWVKNLRQNWEDCKGRESCQYCSTYGIRCTVSPCYGVNLDRNFEYQWIPPDELRAEHQCGNLYAGSRQMSEAETQALNNYLHQQRITISVFIAFKEGDVLGVMYPFSHTKKRRAFDQIYRQRASRAATSAYSIAGRKYIAGQTSEYLPLYAGGIEDWADGHLGIDNTYTIMMFRPTDTPKSDYLTERVIHEAYAAMDSLLISSLTRHSQHQLAAYTSSKSSRFHPSFVIIILTSLPSLIFSQYVIYKNTVT